jgi:hypothetical protein
MKRSDGHLAYLLSSSSIVCLEICLRQPLHEAVDAARALNWNRRLQ